MAAILTVVMNRYLSNVYRLFSMMSANEVFWLEMMMLMTMFRSRRFSTLLIDKR